MATAREQLAPEPVTDHLRDLRSTVDFLRKIRGKSVGDFQQADLRWVPFMVSAVNFFILKGQNKIILRIKTKIFACGGH